MRHWTLGIALLFAARLATAADLTVDIADVKDAEGNVRVSLYDKAEGWLGKSWKATTTKASPGTVTVNFRDIPEGEYAVVTYHDRNGNGKLDSNFLKMPTEPWGFSNDAVGRFGPPGFKDARFALPAAGTRVTIHLKDGF